MSEQTSIIQNETGHIEQTDEDLVEGGLPIFENSNVIEEDIYGVTFHDDEYHTGSPVDLNGKIREIEATDNTTTLLAAASSSADDESVIVNVRESTGNERNSKHIIDAAIGIGLAVNEFGEFIIKGSRCPVCGKPVKYIPSNGYCSLECAGRDLLRKLTSAVTGEYQVETPDIIKQIKNIIDYLNLSLNVVSKIPDLLASLATFPREYKDYVTVKINLMFIELKRIINLILIKKNELVIKLLRRIKFGTIDDKLLSLFSTIKQVISAVSLAKEALDNALAAAYEAINKASGMFYIGPLEYGFFTTLKSFMAICPYYKTDARVYPPGLLGRPFWGSDVKNIAFDMSKCQFSLDIGSMSALQHVDMQKINKIVRAIFRPITTPEYLMDPDLFDIRLAFSDVNSSAVLKLIKLLSKVVVIGGDFIPAYEDLNLTNIWFVIAILTCWGPWTRSIYGDFIFHGAL